MDCPNCNSPKLVTSNCSNCGYEFSVNPIPETIPQSDYEGPLYLYISVKRLIVMSILSLGMYEAYWIYKNWSYIKKREKLTISPFWRGYFGIFFCHSLLKKIHADPVLNKTESPRFSPSVLATWWVVTSIICRIVNRYSNNLKNAGIELLILLITLPSFLFFIPVQKYINNGLESLGYNEKYNLWSKGHIVCLIWGLSFWILIISSLFS
jgi:hypothetical protein